MSVKRLSLVWLTAACWFAGAILMQSAVGDHMSFSLAAVIAGLFALVVALVPLRPVVLTSVFAPIFVLAAVWLAAIEWDWRPLAAGLAFAAAGVIGFAAYFVDSPAAQGQAVAEPGAGGGGRRRLIAAYRRHRPRAARPSRGGWQPAADPAGDGQREDDGSTGGN